MVSGVSGRLILSLVLFCVVRAVHAQAMADPALIDMTAKMKPGQSLVRSAMKLTLNQRDAGTKDANGWFLAQSDRGGFSVRLPGPINDVTVVSKDKHSQIEVNMLTTRTPSMNFIVYCAKQSGHEFSIDEVRRLVAALGDPKHFKSEAFSSGPMSGFEYSGIDPAGNYIAGRMFLLNKQLCQFLVGSHIRTDGITPEIRGALESFQSKN
jgi:hypothetical protein